MIYLLDTFALLAPYRQESGWEQVQSTPLSSPITETLFFTRAIELFEGLEINWNQAFSGL